MKVSVTVLTYNRPKYAEHLMIQLGLLNRVDEILLVDNSTNDETQALVEQFPEVRYFRNPINLGAVGRNVGMGQATGDIVITLDDDVDGLTDAGIEAAIARFDNEFLGALNFRVVDAEGSLCNWVHHRDKAESFDDFLTYEITEGACAFRKSVINQVMYPVDFFMSHEGPDLALQIMDAGYEVGYSGSVQVIHSFSPYGRTPWRNYYYDTRNCIWLGIRHFPPLHLLKYVGKGVGSMFWYSLRDGHLRHWARAIFDAVSELPDVIDQRKVVKQETMDLIREIDRARPKVSLCQKLRQDVVSLQ